MNINKVSILFSVLLGALTCSSQSFSQDFGKLFTAPEERAYLDYLREDFLTRSAELGFDIADDAVPDIPDAADGQVQDAVEFHLGGIMTRIDGGRTVWLNAVPLLERELPPTAQIVSENGIAALRLTTPDGIFVLKPGQTVDVTTGEFWDAYERRSSAESIDEGLSSEEFEAGLIPDEVSAALSDNVDLLRSLQFLPEDEDEE